MFRRLTSGNRGQLAPLLVSFLLALLFVVFVWLLGLIDLASVGACGFGNSLRASVAYGLKEEWQREVKNSLLVYAPRCVKARPIQEFEDQRSSTPYFYDSSYGGLDYDSANGIDTAPLFFLVSHGDRYQWEGQGPVAQPTLATTGQMNIGNVGEVGGGGRLRYYFQCSCQSFAHGRDRPRFGYRDFNTPWIFDPKFGGNAQESQANVISTWSGALGKGIRLACGSSDRLFCTSKTSKFFWWSKSASFDVADSFIVGLLSDPQALPLCVSRGPLSLANNVEKTALFDKVLTDASPDRTEGSDAAYISYSEPFVCRRRQELWGYRGSDSGKAPLFSLFQSQDVGDSMDAQRLYKGNGKSGLPTDVPGDPLVSGLPDMIYFDRVVARNATIFNPRFARCSSEVFYFNRAKKFLLDSGWNKGDMVDADGYRIMIDVYKSQDFVRRLRYQKNVLCFFSRARRIQYGGAWRSVELEGSAVVQLDNAGRVLGAWRYWPEIRSAGLHVLRSSSKAIAEANQQLGAKAEMYDLGNPAITYQIIGKQMRPFFRFRARVKKPEGLTDLPEREIYVPAIKE